MAGVLIRVKGVSVQLDTWTRVELTPWGSSVWAEWGPVPESGVVVARLSLIMRLFGPHLRGDEDDRRNDFFVGGNLHFLGESQSEACNNCKGKPLLDVKGKAYVCQPCGGTGRVSVK
jgi:hypothetical protein